MRPTKIVSLLAAGMGLVVSATASAYNPYAGRQDFATVIQEDPAAITVPVVRPPARSATRVPGAIDPDRVDAPRAPEVQVRNGELPGARVRPAEAPPAQAAQPEPKKTEVKSGVDVLSGVDKISPPAVVKNGEVKPPEPKPAEVKPVEAKPVPPEWVLKGGVAIHVQLAEWAKKAGWSFFWKASKSWMIPAEAKFMGEFDVALEAVMRGLYEQGRPLKLIIWEGNKVVEIVDADSV